MTTTDIADPDTKQWISVKWSRDETHYEVTHHTQTVLAVAEPTSKGAAWGTPYMHATRAAARISEERGIPLDDTIVEYLDMLEEVGTCEHLAADIA